MGLLILLFLQNEMEEEDSDDSVFFRTDGERVRKRNPRKKKPEKAFSHCTCKADAKADFLVLRVCIAYLFSLPQKGSDAHVPASLLVKRTAPLSVT